jgi:hypothetical protein
MKMSRDVEVIVEITLINDNKEIFKCDSNALSDATNLKILEEVDNYYYARRENEDE